MLLEEWLLANASETCSTQETLRPGLVPCVATGTEDICRPFSNGNHQVEFPPDQSFRICRS